MNKKEIDEKEEILTMAEKLQKLKQSEYEDKKYDTP